MELCLIIFILVLIAVVCYKIYDDMPSKYTKLEESFGGFMNRSLVSIEFEKSPLHTIVYGGTGTGKTYFVRQYLKLYQNQMVEEDQKRIIIVCKDERDWINPETGKHYSDLNMCDMKEITSKNIDNFQNCVIVLDDIRNKIKSDIADYFAEGRHADIQMIVIGHKPAQIVNTARMSCDTIILQLIMGQIYLEILMIHTNVNMTSMV